MKNCISINKEKLEDHNMSLVGLETIRILTDYVQKYPHTLVLLSHLFPLERERIITYERISHPSNLKDLK